MTYVNEIIEMVTEEYDQSERETSELIAEANLRLDPINYFFPVSFGQV